MNLERERVRSWVKGNLYEEELEKGKEVGGDLERCIRSTDRWLDCEPSSGISLHRIALVLVLIDIAKL